MLLIDRPCFSGMQSFNVIPKHIGVVMRFIRPCSIGEFIYECSGRLRKSAMQGQTGCSISYRADSKGEVSAFVYSPLSSVQEAAFLTFGCESSSLDPKGGHQFVAHPLPNVAPRVAKGQQT